MKLKCVPSHKHCSKSHYELVRGYQQERERQETMYEMAIAYGEDHPKLIDFKTWLKGNTCSSR